MFMKQIMTEIVEYTRNIFEAFEPYKKHTMKKLNSKTIDFNTKTNKSSHKKSSHKKSSQEQEGGFKKNKQIKVKQRRFGVLKNYKVIIEFKNNNQTERVKEAIDITDLSYEDTYKLIMDKSLDPDTMIIPKIIYTIKYIKLLIAFSKFSSARGISSLSLYMRPRIQNAA